MFGLAISQLRKTSKLCSVSKYQLWQIDFFPGSAYGSEEAATGIHRNQWDLSQEFWIVICSPNACGRQFRMEQQL